MPSKTEDFSLLPFESEEQFDQAYRKYYSALVGFFIRRGICKEEARELAQEAFLRIFRSRQTFDGKCQEATWIFTIADNVWKNRLRYISAEKRQREDVPFEGEGPAGSDLPRSQESYLDRRPQDPLNSALRGERKRLLRQAISELAPRMRQCVRLRAFQDLSYREIAETMQISIDTVKPLLNQAKKRLRKKLRHQWPDVEF